MNTIAKNKRIWSDFHWDRHGEHWSDGWGGHFAQWNFSVRPRIAKFLPSGDMVEIATGFGRWTRYLVDHANSYTGFDLVEKCVAHCENVYGGPNRRFIANDGLHLTGVADASIDFVFSMDSLVHVDWPTLQSYLAEIARVLKPGGAAMIHHSNAADVEGFADLDPPKRQAFRAPDVSAQMVREELAKLNKGTYSQEIVDWGSSGPGALIDCFTTIVTEPVETQIVRNPEFMTDMRHIKKISHIYS